MVHIQSLKDFANSLLEHPKAGIKAGNFVSFKVEDTTYYGVVIGIFVNVFTSTSQGDKPDYSDITIGQVFKTINLKVWTTTDEEFGISLDEVTKLENNPFKE